jgi:hypothetical protein
MRWLNPLQANRREALLERARFCQRHGLALLRLARGLASTPPAVAGTFREAAAVHFRRRREHLLELRAITPRARR